MFLRAVDDKGNIFIVPFDMKQVPGSLTGEVLCEEIINQIFKSKLFRTMQQVLYLKHSKAVLMIILMRTS